MSYFVVIAAPDRNCCEKGLPEDIRLVPLRDTQRYVQEYVPKHVMDCQRGCPPHIYLAADETDDTSSDLVSEVQDEMRIHGRRFEQTRLGVLLELAFEQRWRVCVWWADPTLPDPIWLRDKESFRDHLLKQLYTTGNISIGYLPE